MAESLAAKLEAILYLKGEPLTVPQLANIARCGRATTEEALLDLLDDYAHRNSALEIGRASCRERV